jgi:hypothetical protein
MKKPPANTGGFFFGLGNFSAESVVGLGVIQWQSSCLAGNFFQAFDVVLKSLS